jgi:gamma-glutamyltranspeptidase
VFSQTTELSAGVDIQGEKMTNTHHDSDTHSSSVVAMDSDGNVCSMPHSINSGLFGTYLFVDGVALSSAGKTNALAVKHATEIGEEIIQSEVMPALATSCEGDGDECKHDVVAVACIGASLTAATPQLFTNMVDSHLHPQAAADAAKYFIQEVTDGYSQHWLLNGSVETGTFSYSVLEQARDNARGTTFGISELDLAKSNALRGYPSLLAANETHLFAGSTKYLNGYSHAVRDG